MRGQPPSVLNTHFFGKSFSLDEEDRGITGKYSEEITTNKANSTRNVGAYTKPYTMFVEGSQR